MSIDTFAKIGIISAAGITAIMAAALYMSIQFQSSVKQYMNQHEQNIECMRAYRKALAKHADANNDGLISDEERKAFDCRLLKDKGATVLYPDTLSSDLMIGNLPRYSKDGSEVPLETVLEWIKNYKP